MKRLMMLLLVLAVTLMHSGCATMWDKDIAVSNNETIQNHDTKQAEGVKSKVDGIVKVNESVKCEDNTQACGMAKAFSSALASRDIASVQTQEYKGPVMKTGVDVQDKIVEKTGAQIPIGIVAYTQAKKGTGDHNEINKGGGDIKGSFTKKDQTAIAGGNASNTDSTKKDSENPVDNSVTGEDPAATTTP
jgi:hypothetical protein